jgi:hypothetical protein
MQREDGISCMTDAQLVLIGTIIVAVLGFAGTLSGSYFAQRKSTALISYRIEQLEEKVHMHNNLIERTYAIEKKCGVCEEKIKVANSRIKDLEEKEK